MALGPLAWIVIHDDHPTGFKREPITADQPALEIVADILVTGPYPVAVWAAPFLLGMWLGRLNLRDPRVSLRLIVWGGLTAVSARAASALLIRALGEPSSHNDWQRLVSDVAHSEMPLWVIGGTGSAVFVLGLCLRVPTWNRPWLSPLTSLGRLALTAYAAHLVVLALLVRPGPEGLAAGAAATALLCGALMLFAVIWLRVMQRGLSKRCSGSRDRPRPHSTPRGRTRRNRLRRPHGRPERSSLPSPALVRRPRHTDRLTKTGAADSACAPTKASLVPQTGFEPVTPALGERCSIP